MLLGDDVVLVVGVEGLMAGRDVDIFGGEAGGAGEVFEEVGVVGGVEVDVGVGGIFCLEGGCEGVCQDGGVGVLTMFVV